MHASDSHVEVTRDERGTTVKLLDSSTMIAPRTPRPILDQRARDAEARHLVRHHPYPHERAVRPPPKLQHKQRAKEQLKEQHVRVHEFREPCFRPPPKLQQVKAKERQPTQPLRQLSHAKQQVSAAEPRVLLQPPARRGVRFVRKETLTARPALLSDAGLSKTLLAACDGLDKALGPAPPGTCARCRKAAPLCRAPGCVHVDSSSRLPPCAPTVCAGCVADLQAACDADELSAPATSQLYCPRCRRECA
jgi:hypothetical protein